MMSKGPLLCSTVTGVRKLVLALKPVEPYRVFLSDPGKSHVIKLIHSDTLKLLQLSGTFEPDDVIVLLNIGVN